MSLVVASVIMRGSIRPFWAQDRVAAFVDFRCPKSLTFASFKVSLAQRFHQGYNRCQIARVEARKRRRMQFAMYGF